MNLADKLDAEYRHLLHVDELNEAINLYEEGLNKTVESGEVQDNFTYFYNMLHTFAEKNPNFNTHSKGPKGHMFLTPFYANVDMQTRRKAYKTKWGREPKW